MVGTYESGLFIVSAFLSEWQATHFLGEVTCKGRANAEAEAASGTLH